MTYRQKNQVMAGVTGVLLLLILGVSVRKTVTLVQDNHRLEAQMHRANQAPAQITQLQARAAQLGQVMAVGGEPNALRRELFEQIGTYCQEHQVQLRSFQEARTFTEGALRVETHALHLEGNFAAQVRVCQALEEHLRRGRVVSLSFRTERDRRSKRVYLSGELLVQGIKEISNE